MQTRKQIHDEIERIRGILNAKMLNTTSRMPDRETIELSHKMDELLNLLQGYII